MSNYYHTLHQTITPHPIQREIIKITSETQIKTPEKASIQPRRSSNKLSILSDDHYKIYSNADLINTLELQEKFIIIRQKTNNQTNE